MYIYAQINFYRERSAILNKEKNSADRLATALFTIHDGITNTLAQEFLCNEKDISMKQHLVMTKVYNMMKKTPEGIPLKDLAAALHLTPGTVSELVENLVRKNALQRVQNPNDRRAVMITITERSNQRLLEAKARINSYLEQLWEDFSDSTRAELIRTLEILSERIQQKKQA